MQDEISGEATATTLVAVIRTAPWPVTADAVRARALDKLEQDIIGAHYSTKLPMDAAKGRVAAAIVRFSNVFVKSAPYLDHLNALYCRPHTRALTHASILTSPNARTLSPKRFSGSGCLIEKRASRNVTSLLIRGKTRLECINEEITTCRG
jgi:hypothetical protein